MRREKGEGNREREGITGETEIFEESERLEERKRGSNEMQRET